MVVETKITVDRDNPDLHLVDRGRFAYRFYGWQLFRSGLAMIGIEVTSPLILISIQWISILLVMLFVCEVIYNLLPNYKRPKWR